MPKRSGDHLVADPRRMDAKVFEEHLWCELWDALKKVEARRRKSFAEQLIEYAFMEPKIAVAVARKFWPDLTKHNREETRLSFSMTTTLKINPQDISKRAAYLSNRLTTLGLASPQPAIEAELTTESTNNGGAAESA